MSFSDEQDIKRLLKEQPFYNVPIENLKIKKLNNSDMLSELLFYDKLSIVQTAKAFKGYGRSYSIEIIKDKDGVIKDPLAASKPVIQYLFRDLFNEIKGFNIK